MNILVVNYRDRMHPAAGGAEKHLHRIFKRIVEMGHKVVLLTTMFDGAQNAMLSMVFRLYAKAMT